MKTQFVHSCKTIFFLIAIAAFTTSCSSDDDASNDDGPAGNGANFSAQVNGVDFNPSFVTGFRTAIINNITITGSMADGEQIQLFIPDDTAATSYAFDQNELPTFVAFYQTSDGDTTEVAAFANSGTLTITEHDTEAMTIKGSFVFSGTVPDTGEIYSITQGSFDVSYTDI